ncbi:DUF6415 family natural product biosynthesis protein [Streptomyces sp. UP1A-1]|nr:DUF6415 family natural product biosynthesis protein [Streptomyces sp. UP1A-1]
MATTQQPIDADDVAHLIEEALGATGILPPMSRLVELDKLLRAEIERLVTVVQRKADATPLRSREWYTLVQAADRAEDALQYQIGAAPLAERDPRRGVGPPYPRAARGRRHRAVNCSICDEPIEPGQPFRRHARRDARGRALPAAHTHKACRDKPRTVPFIAQWSGEIVPEPTVVPRLLGGGICYAGEQPGDRDDRGVLWKRHVDRPGMGRPLYGKVHAGRQRRAMAELLCQVCGGPADEDDRGVLWLLEDDRESSPTWPEDLMTTHPRSASTACVPRGSSARTCGRATSPCASQLPRCARCTASGTRRAGSGRSPSSPGRCLSSLRCCRTWSPRSSCEPCTRARS